MKKFKILVTDHLAEEGLKILAADKAVEVEVKAGIKVEELKTIIGNYDAIITRSGTTVKESLIENPGG
jgi:D-3-phosphoglycerate dehydrogenase